MFIDGGTQNSLSHVIWQVYGGKQYDPKGEFIMTTKSKAREKVKVKVKPEHKVKDAELKKTESLIPSLRHEIEDTVAHVLDSWPRFSSKWHWPEFDMPGKIDIPKPLASARNLPRVDFSEVDNGYELTAELPGMGEEDVECTLSGNMLTVKGEKQEVKEEVNVVTDKDNPFTRSVMRNFTLPEDTVTDKLEATVSDGVLRVFMPKGEKRPKTRKIEVKKS